MDSDNDIINIDDAPSLQDELERLQNSEEFTEKILKVFRNIVNAAERGSEFMAATLNDPDVPVREKFEIAQYAVNRLLGSPTNRLNMKVDSRSVSTRLQLQTPVEKVGASYRRYVGEVAENPSPMLENKEQLTIDASVETGDASPASSE
jgi:hypothetical protein